MSVLRVRVALARLHRHIGVVGFAGLLLAASAVAVAGLSWREQRRFEFESSGSTADAGTPVIEKAQTAGRVVPLPLRPPSEIALLLTRMERVAVQQNLGWPRADYRLNAAIAEAPASLEVHCVLKGPYPNIRGFVTALLQDTPSLTLREFSLARTSADAAEVEAKLGIVVYLSSDTSVVTASGGSTH